MLGIMYLMPIDQIRNTPRNILIKNKLQEKSLLLAKHSLIKKQKKKIIAGQNSVRSKDEYVYYSAATLQVSFASPGLPFPPDP